MILHTGSIARIGRTLAVLLLAMAAAVLMAACGTAAEDTMPIRVSVIFPHHDDGYWSVVEDGMKGELEDAEAAGLDIKFYYPQINYSSAEIADLIRQQVAARVDALVLQGSENEAFLQALDEAVSAGIRIILMDTDCEQAGDHLYIGSDHYEIGRMMGESIAAMAQDARTAVVVTGSSEYSNLQQRLAGLRDALAENSTIEITEVLEDRFDSTTFMQCYQNAQGNDVLISIEGTGCITLSEVMGVRQSKLYPYVFGMDDISIVPEGYVDGVLMQETKEIGRAVIEELVRYQESGAYSADTIHTDIYWVTRDNYEEAVQHAADQS